ncbi:MAG: IMPACT family protein [Bacteroidales bacterium]|nr:IMPACT family protein [Bacteroidales bacterium]
MPTDTYKTIKAPSEGYFIDKRSKFYAFAYPVETEDEIKEHLSVLKKQYHDARHHVYAWILGAEKAQYRANDDGEPAGSSAKPVYRELISNDLTNILIIVVRYFGGIKLGVPGLINAYRTAAEYAIENAEIVEKAVEDCFEIRYDYVQMNEVMKILKEEPVTIVSQEFDNQCKIVLRTRRGDSDRVKSRLEQVSGLCVVQKFHVLLHH